MFHAPASNARGYRETNAPFFRFHTAEYRDRQIEICTLHKRNNGKNQRRCESVQITNTFLRWILERDILIGLLQLFAPFVRVWQLYIPIESYINIIPCILSYHTAFSQITRPLRIDRLKTTQRPTVHHSHLTNCIRRGHIVAKNGDVMRHLDQPKLYVCNLVPKCQLLGCQHINLFIIEDIHNSCYFKNYRILCKNSH